MRLADAFIQSVLTWIQVIFFCQYVHTILYFLSLSLLG